MIKKRLIVLFLIVFSIFIFSINIKTNASNSNYRLVSVSTGIINNDSYQIVYYNELDIDYNGSDNYYIGFLGNGCNGSVNIFMNRLYNNISSLRYNNDYVLFGNYNRYSFDRNDGLVTVGLSKIIDLPIIHNHDSKLDYYWYSSNDEIATITQYGTLLTKKAGTVRITCVDKTDFYNLYYCDIIIVEDDNFNDINHENETQAYLVNQNNIRVIDEITYQETLYIRLNNSISPYVQDYDWVSEVETIIRVSAFGTITCVNDSINDFIRVIGTNKYNSNYTVTLVIEVCN